MGGGLALDEMCLLVDWFLHALGTSRQCCLLLFLEGVLNSKLNNELCSARCITECCFECGPFPCFSAINDFHLFMCPSLTSCRVPVGLLDSQKSL